jgi:hypothetical protein
LTFCAVLRREQLQNQDKNHQYQLADSCNPQKILHSYQIAKNKVI